MGKGFTPCRRGRRREGEDAVNDLPDQNPDPPVEYDPRDDPGPKSNPPITWSRATQRRILRGACGLFEDIPAAYGPRAAISISIFLSAIADGEEWR